MSIHQNNPNKRPDSDFIPGDVSFLCAGNKCRLLDGRRTPGCIETVDFESGMFKWRILDFEDKGNYWEIPFEGIDSYQFEKTSNQLSTDECKRVKLIIEKYKQPLTIVVDENKRQTTEQELKKLEADVVQWLNENSDFVASDERLDFSSNIGPKDLIDAFLRYMKDMGLGEMETRTANQIVLNPGSGEWIKGMAIVLAELGLVSFHGKITRTKDVFLGQGTRENREKYLLHRLAFLRALFHHLNLTEVPLYRGMCSEGDWRKSQKTFVSFTFSNTVAKSFTDLDGESSIKSAYFLKATVPVTKLFMTYLETRQMNERYKEAEALLLNTLDIVF